MFWEHRRRNVYFTWLLLMGFVLLLVGTAWLVDLAMGAGAAPFFAGIALLIAVPGALYTYWKSDEIVLRMTHAEPVDPTQHPHLHHATEGLAIAAGIPKPRLYILDTDVPNAFATGRNPERGVVAVTRGLMEKMNREELEGVIAHELAHIRNYDILLVTVAAVMAAAIMVIAHISLRAMAFGRGGGRGGGQGQGGAGALIMVLAFLALLLAPLIARLVKLAISRRREFLADAEAARITRNPRGLRNALGKLAGAEQNLLVNDALASLFIVHPLKDRDDDSKIHRRIHQLFMTHPPLEERMRRLDSM